MKSDQAVPEVFARPPVEFSEVKRSSAEMLVQAMEPETADEVLQRLEAGRRCFAGCVGDRVACWGWVSHGSEWIGEMKVHFRMQAGEAYIWDCVTLPSFRRQGLYSALLSHMVKELQGEGITRIWIGSNLENRPSIKGFVRAGFRPVIRVSFLQILGLRFFKVSGYPEAREDLASAASRAFSTGRALRIDPVT